MILICISVQLISCVWLNNWHIFGVKTHWSREGLTSLDCRARVAWVCSRQPMSPTEPYGPFPSSILIIAGRVHYSSSCSRGDMGWWQVRVVIRIPLSKPQNVKRMNVHDYFNQSEFSWIVGAYTLTHWGPRKPNGLKTISIVNLISSLFIKYL